jgi:hypothetical protein
MMAAYFDASGHHKGAKFLVIAGFVASVENWIVFEKEWFEFIKPYGLEYSHAKKIAQWPAEKRKGFYLGANAILKRTSVIGVAATVKHADYIKAFKKFPFTVKDSMYGLTFRAAMVQCCKCITDKSPNESIAFVLESGDPNQGGAKNIFKLTKDGAEAFDHIRSVYPVVSLTIADKKEFGALQAADAHAHVKWKHHQVHPKTIDKNYHGDIIYLLSALDVAHFDLDLDLIREQRLIHGRQNRRRKNKPKASSGKSY